MDAAPRLSALLRDGAARLAAAGIDTARLDAEVLLAAVLGTDRSGLYARLRDAATAAGAASFERSIIRRAGREPLAYILGHKEFYSLDFIVDPAVLIPRPETELLVETVLAHLGDRRNVRIGDVGTGSGCIAIALARALTGARLVASDTSRRALRVARQNAARHDVLDRIDFVAADLLDALNGTFDVIVSNPPYLRPGAARAPELDWEPPSALLAGARGLDAVGRLVSAAPPLLAPGGLLAVEIGAGQDADAMALARAAGLSAVAVTPDLAGIPRVLVGYPVRR